MPAHENLPPTELHMGALPTRRGPLRTANRHGHKQGIGAPGCRWRSISYGGRAGRWRRTEVTGWGARTDHESPNPPPPSMAAGSGGRETFGGHHTSATPRRVRDRGEATPTGRGWPPGMQGELGCWGRRISARQHCTRRDGELEILGEATRGAGRAHRVPVSRR